MNMQESCKYRIKEKKMETKRLDGYSNRAMVRKIRDCEFLISYWTVVGYKDASGKFHKTWDGYSLTTVANHVRRFGFNYSKREWENLPLDKLPYGFGCDDVMSYDDKKREIPGYSENYDMGTSYSNGWSYGF